MSIAHAHHKMLFELLPDEFPPFFTEDEGVLWGKFYEELNAKASNVRR